jgi:hypothetical protein
MQLRDYGQPRVLAPVMPSWMETIDAPPVHVHPAGVHRPGRHVHGCRSRVRVGNPRAQFWVDSFSGDRLDKDVTGSGAGFETDLSTLDIHRRVIL